VKWLNDLLRRAAPVKNGWQRYSFPGGLLTIDVPLDWTIEDKGQFTLLSTRDGSACVGLLAAVREGGTMDDFASACFRHEKFMNPRGVRSVIGRTWQGVVQDFVGVSPDDTEPSLERVMCVQRGDLFAKVSLFIAERRAQENAALFDAIFQSLALVHLRWR